MHCLSIKSASKSVSFASGMQGDCGKVGLEDRKELGLWEVCGGSSCEDCCGVCGMDSTWIASRTALSVARDHRHRVRVKNFRWLRRNSNSSDIEIRRMYGEDYSMVQLGILIWMCIMMTVFECVIICMYLYSGVSMTVLRVFTSSLLHVVASSRLRVDWGSRGGSAFAR